MQVERTRMYRVSEVAGHFEVSAATIYRAIESGAVGRVEVGDRSGHVAGDRCRGTGLRLGVRTRAGCSGRWGGPGERGCAVSARDRALLRAVGVGRAECR